MKEEIVVIDKIIPGGQGIASLSSRKKALIWGVLAGEKVKIRPYRQKRSYCEAVAEEIIEQSSERVSPREEAYLSTSPWQIFSEKYEEKTKHELLRELFSQHGISLGGFSFVSPDSVYGYRNKMEFSFWWDNDEENIKLAFHRRGSKNKLFVEGSELCHPAINKAAQKLVELMNQLRLEARAFKSVIIRCNQAGETVMALMTKELDCSFKPQHTELGIKGFALYYSNPKSPASVLTECLFVSGETTLNDYLNDKVFSYDVTSFFQVNIPIFEKALTEIQNHLDTNSPVIDMFCGVGSIGLSLGARDLSLVESDLSNSDHLKKNVAVIQSEAHIHISPSEQSTEIITSEHIVIVDPPRAGLHPKLVEALLEKNPKKIIYLSCDPATQARDAAVLLVSYKIDHFSGYNFFPRTPHIESLLVLTPK